MIFLHELALAYGSTRLFENVSVSIQPGDRIGLVGRNGSGKTSLMKILAGWEAGDHGKVEMGTGARVGYLPQDGLILGSGTLLEECRRAFPIVLKLRHELETAEHKLRESDDPVVHAELLQEIAGIEDLMILKDADRMEATIEKVVKGLGFESEDLQKICETFSGGWRMRIALARLILEEPDLLMLDEPTNHLDLESQRWIEGFLCQYSGALLIVSHDRGFLDSVTNRTFHLNHGKLDTYSVSYSGFEEEAAQRREERMQSQQKQQKEIRRVEQFVERFRYKATKARQVQSRIKALARTEQIEVQGEDASIAFSFPDPPRGPQRLVRMENISKNYGDLRVFQNLKFSLERGEKIAVVGRNGRGKSTFARILAGVEPPDSGIREMGEGVVIGWFAQHQAELLNPEHSVLESAVAGNPREANVRQVRSLLGAFLFSGDHVDKKVKVLSGGEKNRLALARILLAKANLLVLDEPTNHLDLASKTVLQGALIEYSGAVVIVAHDRDFLDPIIDRVFAFEPDRIFPYHGNVSAYVEDYESRQSGATPQPSTTGKRSATKVKSGKGERKKALLERQRLAPLQRKVQELENRVQQIEEKIKDLETEMIRPGFYEQPEARNKISQHDKLRTQLDQTLKEWENKGEQLSKAR